MKSTLRKTSENAALFFIILAVSYLLVSDIFPGSYVRWDFLTFYQAAKVSADNVDIYSWQNLESFVDAEDASLNEKHEKSFNTLPYLYPPLLAYALQPLASLDFGDASFFWTLICLIAFSLAVLISYRIALEIFAKSGREKSVLFPYIFVLGILAAFALLLRDNIWIGQVNPIVLFFLALSVYCSFKGRQVNAGAALGIAIMLKITPFVLLAWLAGKNQYKAVLWALISCLILVLLTLPFGAFQNWLNFIEYAPTVSFGAAIGGLKQEMLFANYSLPGILAKIIGWNSLYVKILSILILVGAMLFIYKKTAAGEYPFLLLLPTLIIMVITSPVAYKHHVIYLLPGAAAAGSYIWFFAKGKRLVNEIILLLLLVALGNKFIFLGRFFRGEFFEMFQSTVYAALLALVFVFSFYIKRD